MTSESRVNDELFFVIRFSELEEEDTLDLLDISRNNARLLTEDKS